MQSYKQILPVYLADSLVVSPKTFRNKMVSLQNCHRPCSEAKSNLLRSVWSGGRGPQIWWPGGPPFFESRLLDKSGPGHLCVLD